MTVASRLVAVSAAQRGQAERIERAFRAAGYADGTIAAAIVNAYAESALNPLAVGDAGRSVGLFQLNDRGAGRGYSTAERQSPDRNIAILLDRERRAIGKVDAAARAGESVAKLSAMFSTLVERPSATTAAEAYRSALAVRLFPMGATEAAPGALVPVTVAPAGTPLPGWWRPVAWLSVAILGGVALFAWPRRGAPSRV